MAKKDSSDDGGCLIFIIIIFMCMYTCENRDRIRDLEKKVDKLESLEKCKS